MSLMMTHFPGQYTPRASQSRIIDELEYALGVGFKYIVIQAPTGVGKTAVGVTIGRHFPDAYISTSQKSLQEQYTTEFPEVKKCRGRNTFKCLESAKISEDGTTTYPLTCDIGICTIAESKDPEQSKFVCSRKPRPQAKKESEFPDEEHQAVRGEFACVSSHRGPLFWNDDTPASARCLYWQEKSTALKARICCHNYKYLMTEANFVGDFGHRTVMISDEGHNIEQNIIDMIKVDITNKILQKMARYNENILPTFNEAPPSYKNNQKVEFYQEQLISISQGVPDIVDQILADIDVKNKLLDRFVSLRSDDDRTSVIREDIGEVEYAKILSAQRKEGGRRKVGLTGEDFQHWKDQTENQIADLGKDKQAIEGLKTKIEVFLASYKENPLWVVIETKFDKKPNSPIKALSFQPIFAKEFAQEYFFNLADIHIIMSATILDHEKLAEDLGLSPDDYYFIKEEPTIPPDRNKIYNLGIADFAKQEGIPPECEVEFWKLVTKRIDLILTKHKNQKGIIHGNTHDICKKIKKYSVHKKRILVVDTEDKDSLNDRQKLIDTHFDKKNHNTVICSPSLTEGIDLKQELSEFQILVKVPYPDLSNDWVRERKRRDDKFYKDRTARVICQAIGRSVRSENDYCITYTLDIRFESQYMDWRPRENTELFTRHVMPTPDLRTFWSMEELGELLPRITMLPDGEIEVADWFF